MPESVLERLAALAARIFAAPMAVISLAEHEAVVFRAGAAIVADLIPPDISFFTHAVAGPAVLVVPDTAKDPRFSTDPLIAAGHVRFFAGAPLIGSSGKVIGTISVVDVQSHGQENDGASRALADVAALVVQQFELKRLQEVEDEAHRTEAALRDSESQFRRLVNGVTDYALYMLSPEGIVTNWNAGAERIKGYTADEIVGQHFSKFYTSEERVAGLPARNLRKAIKNGRFEANGWRVRKDGSPFWANVVIDPIYDETGHLIGFAKITRDISERREYEQRLHRLAHVDALTELPNRFALKSRLEDVLESTESVTVLMLDLAGFKVINDTLGHPTGDFVLKAAGERIQHCLGARGTVGRLGGDEFAAVIPGSGDPLVASRLCQAMIDAFRGPFSTVEQDLYIGLSIGVALSPNHGTTAEQLLANADLALYQAKADGLYGYSIFQPGLRQSVVARQNCERELREAVRQGELELFYQPKTRLADGAIVGAEALLRWHHPQHGLLAPKAFIDVLDRSALAPTVGEWAIRSACLHAALIRAMGFADFRIAVNLFGAQFRKSGLVATVTEALREANLAPAGLEVEVTENIIWQHDEAMAEQLQGLRTLGVHVALDDFGTGYASLSLLKRFPLTGLKVDQSFVRDMCTDAESAAVVKAVLYLARCFSFDVTAEGVENEKQEMALRALGCGMGQGFLYGRPMPIRALQVLLRGHADHDKQHRGGSVAFARAIENPPPQQRLRG
ncbi:MAG: EAL domain-containing protein [Xanthobacteraceae bacterium]